MRYLDVFCGKMGRRRTCTTWMFSVEKWALEGHALPGCVLLNNRPEKGMHYPDVFC